MRVESSARVFGEAMEGARDGDELGGRAQRRKRFNDASNEFAHLKASRVTPEQGRTSFPSLAVRRHDGGAGGGELNCN